MRFSRRAFLGGAGALLALPALEILSSSLTRGGRNARAAAPDKPKRLVFVFAPNGMHMPAWTPEATGTAWSSPILDELGDMKPRALVVSGLQNMPGKPEGPGDHGAGTGAFLTCTSVLRTEGDDITNGISVDQIAAAGLGKATRYASLELGLESGSGLGNCDSGFSCAYTHNIAWAGPHTPLPKLTSPRVVFDRLFAGYDPTVTAEVRARRTREGKSVLDWVNAEANALSARVGAGDRQKLDEYLTGVRELEERLAEGDAAVCEAGARPPDGDSDSDPEQHAALMTDLLVTALKCDITRVATLMLANGGSTKTFTFVDPSVTGGHHDISHHQYDPENFRKLTIIDQWEVRQVAALARKLQAVTDADGESVLDRTIIYMSSEISDGNVHNHDDMPVVLVGGGAGAVLPGHVRRDGKHVSDLFLTMLGAVGVPAASVGDDSTTPLNLTAI